jgi:hypothetical protein
LGSTVPSKLATGDEGHHGRTSKRVASEILTTTTKPFFFGFVELEISNSKFVEQAERILSISIVRIPQRSHLAQ